jgi:site-specific DNA-methyltransferase (adenine-specific)
MGVDLNPLAVAVSRAKVAAVDLVDVTDRLQDLARGYRVRGDVEHAPENIKIIYHPRTLAQLLYLRESLDDERPEDAFLKGALLGIMHGKARKDGSSAYLSIDMPNTFSMSPEYVRRYVAKHKLPQLASDVFTKLRERSEWLLREGALAGANVVPALVLRGDATRLETLLKDASAPVPDAIVTSPPYLGVLRYGAFNWIRLWLLGHEPAPIDRLLDSTDSLDRYLSFMASFLDAASRVMRPGGIVALIIGDVNEFGVRLKLAERVWEELAGVTHFDLVRIDDDLWDESVKTTRIWGEERKGRATPMDRVLILRRKTRIKGGRAAA